MRDRALAMKWAEEFVAAGNDTNMLKSEFVRRGVKDSTINDQIRKLRKQGLLPSITDHAQSDVIIEKAKPFLPVQKKYSRRKGT